jgi:hypothetical protein
VAARTQISLSGIIALVCGMVLFYWTVSIRADTPSDVEVEKVSSTPLPTSPPGQDIQVPPPPFSEDIFPCMECHEIIDPNPERRALEEFHEEILLNHDEENRWCLDCHDADNRDVLRLASGKTIPFEESYRLCAQCHGPKFRDWKAGVHGKRMGRWDGKERSYLLCVHCHNPHDPKYPHIAPMAKPESPELTRQLRNQPVEPLVLPEPFPKRSSGVVEDE